MNKWWLLSMMTLVLACKGSLEESSEEETPQAEDPNTSAAPTEPTKTTTTTTGDASAPAVPNAPSIGKKDMDASVDANGAAPAPQACTAGKAETEPNETAAKASKVATGMNCGVVGPGDTDFWSLGVAGAKTLEVDAASDDVEFSLVDDRGFVMVAIFPGDPIDFDTNAAMFVRVTSKTKQSYSIDWQ